MSVAPLPALPASAAWRHVGARTGFEVVAISVGGVGGVGGAAGYGFAGTTTAVQDGAAWTVTYTLEVDPQWRTRSAHVTAAGRSVRLESVGDGRWRVDGTPRPSLDGCLDVDLESSALTNAFPVRRLALDVGRSASTPAAFVRVDLGVERLEQSYLRLPDGPDGSDGHRGPAYDYAAEAFDFRAVLAYDAAGLVRDYPGIAERVL